MGLIHKVIPTEIKKPKLENVELYEFYNKLLIKPEEMLKIKNELNLNDNASEELAVEKIVELKNEADVLKSEKNEVELELKNLKQDHKDLELKIEDFDNKAIEVEKTAKEELLNKAVADKKISESTREAYENSDMDSKVLGTLIDGIKVKPEFKKVSEEVEARNSARSEWNYSKWEQEDPKGLEDLANNFKEEYERLVKTIGTTMKSKI
jgi:hypothetical protein